MSDDPKIKSTKGAPAASPMMPAARLPNGRFPKGTSGNLNGRPKKAEPAWAHRQREFDTVKEANRLVRITENGKAEYITTEQALIRQLLRKGINGDMKAAKMALERIDRAQSSREWRDRQTFKELEYVEQNYEEICAIGGKARGAAMLRNARKKTRKP